MRSAIAMFIAAGMACGAALAQDAAPDVKGLWAGTFRTVIFGNNPHHPGTQTIAEPPRIVSISFSLDIEGQDGSVIWGQSWSNPERKEPFAAIFGSDGRTLVGADSDGSLRIAVLAPGRIEVCYSHSGLSPSGSIVASCGILEKQ